MEEQTMFCVPESEINRVLAAAYKAGVRNLRLDRDRVLVLEREIGMFTNALIQAGMDPASFKPAENG